MSLNPNYSQQEWNLIASIPQLTGLLMSTADYSGIEGTKEELAASVKGIAEGKFKYPENPLVQAIVPDGNSLEDIMLKAKQQQEEIISKVYIDNEQALNQFQKSTLSSYKNIIHYISHQEKAIVVNQFKSWLLYIAEQVAISAIEGTVFAQKADPFSQKERDIFRKIEKALKEDCCSI